jgi:hypothetical protein
MPNTRLFRCVLPLALGATFLATPALSHEGDEDSHGCHGDKRAGEYHCHTPKTPQPEPVTLTYCHVVRGASYCGQTRDACTQRVVQYGGSCEPQLTFSVQ